MPQGINDSTERKEEVNFYVRCEDCGEVENLPDCTCGLCDCELCIAIGDFKVKNCFGPKRRQLKQQFGASDVEHLALAIYNEFHGGSETIYAWEDYKKYKGDEVIKAFRDAAKLVAHVIADTGIGTVYYEDE